MKVRPVQLQVRVASPELQQLWLNSGSDAHSNALNGVRRESLESQGCCRRLNMNYLVGLDEEYNLTIVDAMENFLVRTWNERHNVE
ncbi:hypothetical protein FHG87_021108 [Trinorchestia longiramus]|nr:hypothetical protein FHG87_021108 [Trinorchestia longiramus]